MFRVIFYGILLGALGLGIGYLIFGQVGGEYIEISHLIDPPESFLDEVAETLTGIREVRQQILASGAVGLGFGLLLGAILGRKKRV